MVLRGWLFTDLIAPRCRPDVRYTRSFSTRRAARKSRRDAGAAADEFRPR